MDLLVGLRRRACNVPEAQTVLDSIARHGEWEIAGAHPSLQGPRQQAVPRRGCRRRQGTAAAAEACAAAWCGWTATEPRLGRAGGRRGGGRGVGRHMSVHSMPRNMNSCASGALRIRAGGPSTPSPDHLSGPCHTWLGAWRSRVQQPPLGQHGPLRTAMAAGPELPSLCFGWGYCCCQATPSTEATMHVSGQARDSPFTDLWAGHNCHSVTHFGWHICCGRAKPESRRK